MKTLKWRTNIPQFSSSSSFSPLFAFPCPSLYKYKKIPHDAIQAVVFLLGSIDLSRGKVTVDHHHRPAPPPSSLDGPISLETTYVIPSPDSSPTSSSSTLGSDYDSLGSRKVRFIVQKQSAISSSTPSQHLISSTKSSEMSQRRNLSFVDAVNSKHLDLSTGFFSSSSPFVPVSATFSSSTTTPPEQHRHSNTHFSSSSSTPRTTTITIADNNNLAASPLSVNNHPSLVGADSPSAITLKEAIDANLLDAHSAYVVDTLEQR